MDPEQPEPPEPERDMNMRFGVETDDMLETFRKFMKGPERD